MNPNSPSRPPRLWILWLLGATAGVVAFGAVLVLLPALARQGFSAMLYAKPGFIEAWEPEAVRYVSLAHAVMGGVMVGWGTALFMLTRVLLARGSRVAWQIIVVSVAAWYLPDTGYSLLSGYWQNAVLNTVFAALFAVPLWALRGALRDDG